MLYGVQLWPHLLRGEWCVQGEPFQGSPSQLPCTLHLLASEGEDTGESRKAHEFSRSISPCSI